MRKYGDDVVKMRRSKENIWHWNETELQKRVDKMKAELDILHRETVDAWSDSSVCTDSDDPDKDNWRSKRLA